MQLYYDNQPVSRNFKISDYFKAHELACRGSGHIHMHEGFIQSLEVLRRLMGRSFTINSCCRSKGYNAIIGGHERSLHVYDDSHHPHDGSIAVDISMKGWSVDERKDLQELAWTRGWSIGVANSFMHLDRRTDIGLNQTRFYYK